MKRKTDFKKGQKIDDYILEEPRGAGQDGEVWRVKKKSIEKVFAIKFLNSIEQEDKSRRFVREIKILAALNHPHVITIFDKGEAWNPTTGKLVPYYVMEFLEALPIDITLKQQSERGFLKIFCSLFQQVASPMITIHNKGVTHGDIKPSNILVLPRDNVAKLTDFGFGLLPGENAMIRDEYPSSSYHAPEGLSREEADIYKFGRTLKDCLTAVRLKLSSSEIAALEKLAMALIDDPTSISLENVVSQLETITEIPYRKESMWYYEDLRNLVPELTETETKYWIRDPIHVDIPFTQRCIDIIDLPEFQRLRTLRVSANVNLVYPSATQTRFESALGQYRMVVKYLKGLSNLSQFRDLVGPFELRAALLVSLIQQIGQYPYSSQIYRATGYEAYDPQVLSAFMISEEPLSIMIENEWELDLDIVAQLLKGRYPEASSKPWRLIISILNGPVSAPKLDSLLRLRSKIGIPLGFDLERFSNSLYVSPEGDNLGMQIEDLPILEEFFSSSYMERVLYHRSVIAADRLLVHAFRELSNSGYAFEFLLKTNDWEFLDACIKEAHKRGLSRADNLLRSYSQGKIHKLITSWTHKKNLLVRDDLAFSEELEVEFSKRLGIPFPSGSIIFDSQMPMRPSFDIPVISAAEKLHPIEASPVIASIIGRMEENLLKTRLFASMEVADKLKELSQNDIFKIVSSLIY